MDKRSSVLLLLIGLLMVSLVLASVLLPYDPINSTGPGYLPTMALAVLVPVVGVAVIAWGLRGVLRKDRPERPHAEKRYEVRSGDAVFPNLSAVEALAKLREQTVQGADPFLYDEFGDPMGLAELEEMIALPKRTSDEKRPTDA